MWRHVVPGFLALAFISCIGCHPTDYECVVRYDPWYGYYYQYCYSVPEQDWEHRKCEGGNCQAVHGGACTYNSDCPKGDVCSAGKCVDQKATGGSANGAGGAEVDGSAPSSPGTGGTTADSGANEPVPTSGVGGSSSGGATGAGESTGAGGSGTGARSNGGSTGNGGNPSGSGGTVSAGGSSGTTAAGGVTGTAGSGNAGAGAGGRGPPRLDFACVRDTQCGAGQCASGVCYLGCVSDADCGTADRCSVETGRRICMPDPNPPVRCDESALCRPEQSCVNGGCHDPCASDDDCKNLHDQCMFNLCFPDRRPIGECVLNVECAAGLVCLNARCVKLGG